LFVASSIELMRAECADWVEGARPFLEKHRGKGAERSVIETILKNR
jgi:hypothetical protein